MFKGSHLLHIDPSIKNRSDELFTISVARNESRSEVVTITISQRYPIRCGPTNSDALWYPLKPQDKATNETCLISFHPTMYRGISKRIISSIEVSKCPIEITDASQCNFNDFSGSMPSCNTLKFNVRIGANAKEIMMLKHDVAHSTMDLNDNGDESKVTIWRHNIPKLIMMQ